MKPIENEEYPYCPMGRFMGVALLVALCIFLYLSCEAWVWVYQAWARGR